MGFEQIWAPWRLEYIKGSHRQPDAVNPPLLAGAEPECFLCQGVANPGDPSRHVVDRDRHAIAVLNRYPYNNGHLLVAPLRHQARLDELTDEEHLGLMQMVTRMAALLERVLRPEGFNIGLNLGRAAGAGLPGHLHWHVVPRWMGDTNFMPVLAAVNVIPESLDALWGTLTQAQSDPG